MKTRNDNILTCDPVVESVFRSGNLLSLKDLRAVATCTRSQELHILIQSRARARLRRSSRSLGALYRSGCALAARMRALVWDIESRLAEAGVPAKAVHPSLASPLCRSGFISPAVIYGDLASMAHAVRLVSHPSAWSGGNGNGNDAAGVPRAKLWDVVASSTSGTMRPCLTLILSLVLPVEARLSYLTLRHSAYASPSTDTLGAMVAHIIAGMATHELGPRDVPRLAKSLRGVAPTLEPLSLYVLRQARKGEERTLATRAAERAGMEASLSGFFAAAGDAVLYDPSAWVPWLLGLEERHLVALYVKYLYDGFQ